MLTRARRAATLAAVIALSVLSLVAPATAEEPTPAFTADQLSVLHSNMEDLGIDAATQESLIEKLESEGTVDALNPEAVPVTTIAEDGGEFEGQLAIYEDGSRSRSSLEKGTESTGEVSARGISGCKTTSFSGGSNKTNCLITIEVITHTAKFYANYTLVNSGNSYISKAYNWACSGFCTIETTGIVKRTADLNGPAKAEMRLRISAGPIGTTGYAQLFVEKGRAWTN